MSEFLLTNDESKDIQPFDFSNDKTVFDFLEIVNNPHTEKHSKTVNDILFDFIISSSDESPVYYNESTYLNLARNIRKHFKKGVKVTVNIFSKENNKIVFSNDKISADQLFNDFWNFKQEVWDKLPNATLIDNYITVE